MLPERDPRSGSFFVRSRPLAGTLYSRPSSGPTPTGRPMDATAYLRENRDRNLAELVEFLRIPSVSAKSEHRDDTRRAAEWLAERMRAAGLQTVEVLPTEGHPVVLGEWRGAPGAPTLLLYGHYDVQPAEPLDEWTSPPFEPVVRDGNVYARGSV